MTPFDSDNLVSRDNASFVSKLAAAVHSNELRLHYQTRFIFNSERATILEALVRWQRPEVGLLYPETFITIA